MATSESNVVKQVSTKQVLSFEEMQPTGKKKGKGKGKQTEEKTTKKTGKQKDKTGGSKVHIQKSSSRVKIDSFEEDAKSAPSSSGFRKSSLGLGLKQSVSGRLKSVLFKPKSMLSLEEYSSSSTEEDVEEKLGKKEKKRKKKEKPAKGRKGKSKASFQDKPEKEEEEPPAVAPPPPAQEPEPESAKDDVMAEIMKMKAAAEAGEDYVEEVKEEPKKKKKPPKKKKPKKIKMTAEMLERLKIEAELEAARQAELERKRLEEERKAAIEKERREIADHRLRMEQLKKTYTKLKDMARLKNEQLKQEKELAEWKFYVACDRLPNPSLCDQMNTYLHLWEKEFNETTMDEASQRTTDVTQLLEDLQNLLETATHEEKRHVENWKWIRQLFRDHQKENLEVATYRLLRNIEKNLHRIDIPTADFNFEDENINMTIWLRVQLPTPLPNPRRPPKSRIEVDFPNVKMQVLFPITIDCDCMAIRAMYLKYDHLSDLCPNFYMPDIPSLFSTNLMENVNREWRTKLKYKFDHREKKKVVPVENEDGPQVKEEEPEKEEFNSDEEIPLVSYKKLLPTASEMAISIEDTFYNDTKQHLLITVPDHIINLRRFSILGGVFCLNLVHQPPQPQHFVTMDLQMTKLFLPKKLEHVDFSVTYKPPPPPPPGVRRLPEEIEEEMKQQEEEMDKLMLITLTWPGHVIFLELPIVCHWDEKERVWSKKNVHDLKHNEEKGILTFRTGLFGTYGLATIRYVNLPYQAWDLKPEEDGSVTFQITAAILMLEFNVKDGLVCLSQLQNSPNRALTEIVGQYFKLYKLKRKMKEAGIDVFPEQDAFCYIEGACEKHWPMEKHLYYNMAQLALCFNFAWSRWNVTAGRRNIVLQMREYTSAKGKQKTHSMLLVTPQKATFVECTEVSQVFCEDDIEGLKFSADLYHLMKATNSITVRKKVQGTSWELVFALFRLLVSVRVLSFS